MKSKLAKLMAYYEIADLDELNAAISQYYANASVSAFVLSKLYRNKLRRFPLSALLDLCQIFGLTQVSQIIDFDHAETESYPFLEYPPESVGIQSALHSLMEARSMDQWKLHEKTALSTATINRWFHDFSDLKSIGIDTLESLGKALELKTIDELFLLSYCGGGSNSAKRSRLTVRAHFRSQPVSAYEAPRSSPNSVLITLPYTA